MKLHLDDKIFKELIKLTAIELKINRPFVEKDYWITLVLSRLAKSKYVDESVFKGGTSLSKGYNLIERFSEDVDIAIINDKGKTGKEIKTIIRNIEKYIEQYNLQSFEVNVLSKEQTLLEKMVSLIRFSFTENTVESISEKIRHFYDLYYLMKSPECIEFAASDSLKKQFDNILRHYREMFEEPKDWQTKSISESPLVTNFSTLWKQIKEKYQTELSALAYRPIPDEKDVAKCFEELIKRIE